MEKKEMQFEDFLNDIGQDYAELVGRIHDSLLQSGCVVKMQLAKSGHVVSYSDPKTKRAVANFVSRKKGPVIRIYGDHANKRIDFLETLPAEMQSSIAKSSDCKRMLDPAKCNSRCSMGYDFTIKDARYQKCRYNCFMFDINAENNPFIMELLENEIKERAL